VHDALSCVVSQSLLCCAVMGGVRVSGFMYVHAHPPSRTTKQDETATPTTRLINPSIQSVDFSYLNCDDCPDVDHCSSS